jgi:hypothetical protein
MRLDKQEVKDGEEQDHKEACSEKCLQDVAGEVDWPHIEVLSRERAVAAEGTEEGDFQEGCIRRVEDAS